MTLKRNIWSLFLVLFFALLALPSFAGTGQIRPDPGGQGKLLDLTVYFKYQETNFARWETVFRESHQQLWVATNGELRMGRVTFTTDKAAEKIADVIIGERGGGYATAPFPGLGSKTGRLFIFLSELNDPQGTPSLSMVLTHEIGHYVFGLGDEYTGFEYRNQGGVFVRGEKKQTAFCASSSDLEGNIPNNTCIMSDNNQPARFFQFCLHGDHPGAHLTQNSISGGYNLNDQQAENRTSCWGSIAKVLKIEAPTSPPNKPRTENPPSGVVFRVSQPEACVLMAVQDTTSFTDDSLDLFLQAALRGLNLIRLPQTGVTNGDFAGIFLFDTELAEVVPVTRFTSKAQIDAIRAGAGDFEPEGTTVDIDAVLRSCITQFKQAETTNNLTFSTKTVMLILNGSQDNSALDDSLISALREANVRVNAIVLSSNLEAESLQKLTRVVNQTGGSWSQAQVATVSPRGILAQMGLSDEDKLDLLADIAEDIADGFAGIPLDYAEITLAPNTQVEEEFEIDEFLDAVGFQVELDGDGPIDISLTDPSGNEIDFNNLPNNFIVEELDDYVFVGIQSPAAGDWTIEVDTTGATAEQTLYVEGFGFGTNLLSINDEENEVDFPRPIPLCVEVASDEAVIGAQVQAMVIHPDGRETPITLFDDGNQAEHNDELAADGVYSNFFTQFSSSGDYEVRVSVVNENGQFTNNHIGNEPNRISQTSNQTVLRQAPPFEREASTSFLVNAVPNGGGTALLPAANLSVSAGAPGQAVLRWTNPNGTPVTFRIERAIGSDQSFTELLTTEAGITEFIDTSTGINGLVFYRVFALQNGVQSTQSNIAQLNTRLAASIFASAGASNSSGFRSEEDNGFCFVATAAYGSYLEPEVQALRVFRDNTLMATRIGRSIVKTYYAWSPSAANFIANNEWARVLARLVLTPVVKVVLYPLTSLLCLLVLLFGIRLRRQRALALPSATIS